MAVVRFQDLPLADRSRRWDGDAANKRLRKWAGADEKPNLRYRNGFIWYDGEAPDKFGSYKLQIADVVGGRLKAVPRGVMIEAAVMQGARGRIDLPKKEIPRARSHLARYYRKMGEDPPWERD